ncbi:MAG: hypothetical protein LBM96_00745 [Methanobrevibacter sp.]|jgi:hypothetical protein|nr:hypothetical protein [Candidatus Methanoflexus mossambicus]
MKSYIIKRNNITPLVNKAMKIDLEIKPLSFDTETLKGELIQPTMDPDSVREMTNKSGTLSDCINAFSEDIILKGVVTFKDADEELENFYTDENLLELFYAIKDYIKHGYGVCEVIYKDNKPYSLKQIPAYTCRPVRRETSRDSQGNSVYSYYVQQVDPNQSSKKQEFRVSRYDYDGDDVNLPEVLWLGKGEESDWYDKPIFFSKYNDIVLDVAISILDVENIESGNLITGVLTFAGDIDEDFEEELEKEISETGNGVLTLIVRNKNPIPGQDSKPPLINFNKLDRDNGETLATKQKTAQDMILQSFKMPPTRLGRLDDKESMNSNKSQNVWDIYTGTVSTSQMILQLMINEFNKKKFEKNNPITFAKPSFYDETSEKSKEIREDAKVGLLAYDEAIKALSDLQPELAIDLSRVENDPALKERYYNGKILGQDNENETEVLDRLDESLNDAKFSQQE